MMMHKLEYVLMTHFFVVASLSVYPSIRLSFHHDAAGGVAVDIYDKLYK